ncbi:putative reverse transcriptase domain-containing protein [Tanacetum coccineum]
MTMSLMHQWRDTICDGVISPRRSSLNGAYGCILDILFRSVQMVGTRGSTPEFSGPAFEAVVQRAVDALLHGLTTRLTNEIRQNDTGEVVTNLPPSTPSWKGLGNRSLDLLAPQPLQLMLKTGLLTLRRYSRFWDVLMNSRLGWQVTSWKEMISIGKMLLNKPKEYFPRSEQQKYEREYHTICQRDGETSGEFMKRFLRLADGIVNTEFTDVAQVANVARNIEILRERSGQNNKRNRDGDRIRPTAQDSNQRGYDQKGYNGRSYDRQGGDSNQKSWQNRGQQYNRSSGSSGQKGYPDYASSPPCDTYGKLHPGKACHRITGACFTCGSTGHMARDYPKNGGNGGRGNGNDNQPAAKGRVFSSTKDQTANSSGTVSGTLFLNGRAVFVLFDTCATHSVLSLTFSKHIKVSSTPLDFALSISTPMRNNVVLSHELGVVRFANFLHLEMSDFDIILGMHWLIEHRATIDCHTKCVIFGDKKNLEFIYQGSGPRKPIKIISAL